MQHPGNSDPKIVPMISDSYEPTDGPLIVQAHVTRRPKWLRPEREIHPLALCLRSPTSSSLEWIRPRCHWRYIICTLFASYVSICLVLQTSLLAAPLPAYTGVHDVGAIDIEIPLAEPQIISDTVLRKTGESAFKHETTLFTIYYPAKKGAQETSSKHSWLNRPIGLTAEGYARLIHMNNFIVRPLLTFALWAVAGSLRIPAKVDVPLLGADDESFSGGQSRLPVMVFSHGDASSRTDYTHFIGELASRGYVIAALEHRDGSCPGSTIKIKGGSEKKVVGFAEDDLLSNPPMNTSRWKSEQLAMRDAEILEAIKILRSIDEGYGQDLFTMNARSEGIALADWKDRLDLDTLTIGGHSFGATGALQTLKSASLSKVNPAIGGIILDPGKSSGPLNQDVDVPILVVHSNSWSKTHSIFYGRPHFETVRNLVRHVLRQTKNQSSWFLTSLGTSHPSITDAPVIEPLLLRFTTGASLNTRQAIQEYVQITREFWDFLRTGYIQPKSVLNEEVTHEEYGKWVSGSRKAEFPKETAKFWEVHVSPASEK